MDLMLDTNIVLDHIGRREPFYRLSRLVCLLGITGEARTFITTSMVTDIFYLLCKDYGSREAQRMIEEELGFLHLVSVTPEDAAEALSRKWDDFEDCLVSCCAQKIKADCIISWSRGESITRRLTGRADSFAGDGGDGSNGAQAR